MPLKRLSRYSPFFAFLLTCLLTVVLWSLTSRSAAQSDLRIYLKAGVIDSSYQTESTIASPYNAPAIPLSSGQLLYIVQFDGPIQTSWRTNLINEDIELSGYYIPNYSYLVRMTPAQIQTVQDLPHVYAVLLFNPAYKPAPDLVLEENGIVELYVTLFSEADIPELGEDVQNWGGAVLEVVWTSDRFALVHINLPDTAVKELLETSYVVYVENYQSPTSLMADTQWVNQGYLRNDTPIWDEGVSGIGETISIHEAIGSSSPYEFEYNNCFFDLAASKVTFFGSPPAACNYTIPPPPAEPYANAGCYHRTGVLAAAVGDAPPYSLPTSQVTYDALAYNSQAVLASTTSNQFTFMNNTILQGSRLANFSWRDSIGSSQYTGSAAAFDDFMWDAMLLNEHMLPFVAAGNEGNNTPNGLVSPGTAKNVVTVGATERYMIGFPERSPENMADISGWGPTADGRIKPDVTTVGWKVRVPLLNTPDGSGSESAAEFQGVNGTSYASPIAASAGALIRDYYLNGYFPGGIIDPSAALVKATLINSGRNMLGVLTGGDIPGDKQGWGRITLDDAMRFSDEPGELQVIDNLIGLATGQQTSYMIQVPDNNSEWELKVSLVWTDWPGATMANPAAEDSQGLGK